MRTLGISCHYHDAAACLVDNGIVMAAAEEERFSRIKHDYRFPSLSAAFCLQQAGIGIDDVDYVVFYEKPAIKLDRVITTLGKNYPRSKELFKEVFKIWGREKLWIKEMIRTRLGVSEKKILFSEHHLSHAASSFYCSPFMESAILTLDGVGEWCTSSWGKGKGNVIERSQMVLFPHSLGLLYTAFTEFLGFEVNEGEYKVMGMAAYGQPVYADKVRQMFHSVSSNGFELDLEYFNFENSTSSNLSSKFLQFWGEARKREEPFFIESYRDDFGDKAEYNMQVMQRSKHYADIAASLQAVVEDIVLGFARYLRQSTGSPNLCIAGGVAYNSAANGRIIREAGFDQVYIQPAAGDSGAALGAAQAVYHTVMGRTSPVILKSAYLGKEYSLQETKDTFDRAGYSYKVIDDKNELAGHVADLLAQGKVIGWHQGRFEFGPRALGNRSILADPRSVAMKEVVNARVKFRELFRPFAPATIKSHAHLYFDLPANAQEQYPYHFMLGVAPVKAHERNRLRAVTHVNNTARVQIVDEETNPLFYQLIKAFGDKTGVYVLLNTSFNRRGEPIVSSPKDALTTFEWSMIDFLVVGNCVVARL